MMKVEGVSYAGNPINNTVMYITKKVEYLINNLENVNCCTVFVEDTVNVPTTIKQKHEIISTKTPQKDYAAFINKLYEETINQNKCRKYTTTEQGYIVGENVKLGRNCLIEPGCIIDHDVVIGDNAHIKMGSRIRNVVIGKNFIACENCTIGTNGFTMTKDDGGNIIRIPTLGKVIIGDNVEINALSNISCGTAGNTIIEDNVKIDSLVHIGHDVYISKNVEIPAGAIIGGFDVLEEGCYIGINATLRNRIRIGKNAFVGMGAVVTKSVDEGITVVGNPAKPFQKI